MTSKIECPRCGGLSASFIQGVCRACYMRDYHQRRSAAAVTPCPRCGVASANFVRGVCRACYMREYHQRRSAAVSQSGKPGDGVAGFRQPSHAALLQPMEAAVEDKQMVSRTPTLGDSERERLCVECEAQRIYARGLCVNCYMRGYMRDRQRQRRLLCVKCGESGTYARGLCRNCYLLDRQQRQRFCVKCGEPGTYARSLCQNCYLRDLRRHRRMKHRACIVCGVSFLSARRDALYCSPSCCEKANRVGKAELFGMAATHEGERGALRSAIETQAARIELQCHAVADLDRRQITSTVEEAAERGQSKPALTDIESRRKARAALIDERKRESATLATLQLEPATVSAKRQQIETKAAPIHVAESVGADTDSERAIRWLLALMVLCCDLPARAPTAAASARDR
jgi:NMD protein affecting ribosome stability and mRNA decay